MFDQSINLQSFFSFDLEHPAEVNKLRECLSSVESSVVPVPEAEGLFDPKTVANTVVALAQYNAIEGDPLNRAMNTARFKISKRLVSEIEQSLDAYLGQLEAVFEQATEQYESAINQLPMKFTAADLPNFDADTFAAYRQAQGSAAMLRGIQGWLQLLADLIPSQRYNFSEYRGHFLILEPESVFTFALIQVHKSTTGDTVYDAVDPVLFEAVRAGATLRMALPAEALESARGWEQERQDMDNAEWESVQGQLAS